MIFFGSPDVSVLLLVTHFAPSFGVERHSAVRTVVGLAPSFLHVALPTVTLSLVRHVQVAALHVHVSLALHLRGWVHHAAAVVPHHALAHDLVHHLRVHHKVLGHHLLHHELIHVHLALLFVFRRHRIHHRGVGHAASHHHLVLHGVVPHHHRHLGVHSHGGSANDAVEVASHWVGCLVVAGLMRLLSVIDLLLGDFIHLLDHFLLVLVFLLGQFHVFFV